MSDAITVSGLDVRFGASHVVKDVRFTVGKGESYGIVGNRARANPPSCARFPG
jgi:ABC-type branched-subunit amino acid transport system ATPase component